MYVFVGVFVREIAAKSSIGMLVPCEGKVYVKQVDTLPVALAVSLWTNICSHELLRPQ